jgi:hypothetical protein
MAANEPSERTDLIDEAVVRLRTMVPRAWEVERPGGTEIDARRPGPAADGSIELRDHRRVSVTVAVQASSSFDPRDVASLSGGLLRVIRSLATYVPLLVVAPWISPRTQELLAEQDINYLDLTGNALLKLDNPALYIRTTGATRNPQPTQRGLARARGPKAARLIRLLLDVRPPYGVSEIAAATGLVPGYVSRLLDALDREALIERARRGRVQDVDIAALLRRWAESYDLLATNAASMFISPSGAAEVLSRIAGLAAPEAVAVSGSFAAVRLAPVAAPALLVAYCDRVDELAKALGLLGADEGANVALLRPYDPVVWERTTQDRAVRYVAPSQVAVDCLTGTGRMPAEGEAMISWMTANESAWRVASLDELVSRTGA